MDLRQLRYFVAVADELHFGRAAKKLFISQPALSADIRRLEEQLGVQLLVRNSKAVALTNAGLVLQREAKRLLHQADEAQHLTLMSAHGVVGRLRVGFVNSMIYRGLPEAVQKFQHDHASVDVTLLEMNTAEQIDALTRNQLDMGLAHTAHFPPGILARRIAVEPFLCCLPRTHPLAGQPAIRVEQLKDDAFIMFPRHVSPHYHDRIIALCVKAGFSPRIKHEVRLWQTVVGMVEKGMGIALVPQAMTRLGTRGAVFVPLERVGVHSETLYICDAQNRPPAAELFLTYLESAMRQVEN